MKYKIITELSIDFLFLNLIFNKTHEPLDMDTEIINADGFYNAIELANFYINSNNKVILVTNVDESTLDKRKVFLDEFLENSGRKEMAKLILISPSLSSFILSKKTMVESFVGRTITNIEYKDIVENKKYELFINDNPCISPEDEYYYCSIYPIINIYYFIKNNSVRSMVNFHFNNYFKYLRYYEDSIYIESNLVLEQLKYEIHFFLLYLGFYKEILIQKLKNRKEYEIILDETLKHLKTKYNCNINYKKDGEFEKYCLYKTLLYSFEQMLNSINNDFLNIEENI